MSFIRKGTQALRTYPHLVGEFYPLGTDVPHPVITLDDPVLDGET